MDKRHTSVFENSLIWFGAAVSIAEIITGTYIAPLGFGKGLLAIITGHIIGCVMLFLAGVIGGKERKSSMETVKMSFGQKGSYLFAVLNIVQLVGWTGIMIYDGAVAANGIWSIHKSVWALIIGVLIVLWILTGIKNLEKLNTVAMSALFILTLAASFVIFNKNSVHATAAEIISFGAAVELSVAMPLSWLPLISDYTREAEKPVKATAVSSIVYTLVSCWMYLIGMAAAIFTAETDIAQIMLKAGFGAAGLVIVILSTVTTTYLDAYSAGVSSETLSPRLKGKWIAIITAVIGTIGAMVFPMDNITEFLYFIGSVFAPMVAIQFADFFILKKDRSNSAVNKRNVVIWIIGFILYRCLMKVDIAVGNTLPDIVVTIIICIIAEKASKFRNRAI